jgi:hypothetical protein
LPHHPEIAGFVAHGPTTVVGGRRHRLIDN